MLTDTTEIKSILDEITIDGYDLLGDVMLLDCLLACGEAIEKHHAPTQ